MSQKDPVNILLVDDQPAKLLTYEAILSELGENLIKAESAREALEYILKNDIAIILTDVVMPDLDGFELAAMIRAHPRFQKIAIMFVSALALSDIDRVKACEHGAVVCTDPSRPRTLAREGPGFRRMLPEGAAAGRVECGTRAAR